MARNPNAAARLIGRAIDLSCVGSPSSSWPISRVAASAAVQSHSKSLTSSGHGASGTVPPQHLHWVALYLSLPLVLQLRLAFTVSISTSLATPNDEPTQSSP